MKIMQQCTKQKEPKNALSANILRLRNNQTAAPIDNFWDSIVRTVFSERCLYQNEHDLKITMFSAWNQVPPEQLAWGINGNSHIRSIQTNGGATHF